MQDSHLEYKSRKFKIFKNDVPFIFPKSGQKLIFDMKSNEHVVISK